MNIFFSCTEKKQREVQEFIPVHVFAYLFSGTVEVFNEGERHIFQPGQTAFFRKNQLAKSIKQPPAGGEYFKSVNIALDHELLYNFSREYDLKTDKPYTGKGLFFPEPNIIFDNYFHSLLPYFDPAQQMDPPLHDLKVKEAILLLLQYNKDLKDLLFDFKQPGKIDLEQFMQKSFMYHVPMEKFAQLTGRSLASFKRDFGKIFNQSPGKWLLERRLMEAHYLIKEKNRRPSDVYLEVGFEDLSHFSYSFKQKFGYNPSTL
jgi:AraC family transcriptional regulator, exoenzyme S synthesis regulatory protein ExsA